jgi:hypothetical protein
MPNGFEYDDIGLRNESVGSEQGSAGEHTVCRRPVLRDDNIVLDRKLVCRKRYPPPLESSNSLMPC